MAAILRCFPSRIMEVSHWIFVFFFELFKAGYNMIHEFVLEKVKFVVVALRFIRPSPFHPPK